MAIALAIAPLAFAGVGLVSARQGTPGKVLQAMGLLVVLALSLGLISPIVGAAAGFGAGIAITLNMPAFEGQMRRRLVGVGLAVAYMSVILLVIPPAGVLAGAVLPGAMVGFADEYGAWRASRDLSRDDG